MTNEMDEHSKACHFFAGFASGKNVINDISLLVFGQ